MGFQRARTKLAPSFTWIDWVVLVGLLLVVCGLIGIAQQFGGPYRPKTEISLSLGSLLWYSILSLARVTLAYFLSLTFALTYGYVAAKSRTAEMILIPLLDIFQSIPVVGFMPGLILALVHLIPGSNLGLELAAIIMIFTGEGWNLVFSFYSSIKSVPQDLREVTSLFRLRSIDVFRTVEVPFAMNGLLWNSMLSMAGGWFFLMVIESIKFGDQDFRLPGIGSYMAVAYENSDTGAVVAGILAMFALILIVDRCVWAPLVVWSERFNHEQSNPTGASRSLVLDLLKKSDVLAKILGAQEDIVKKLELRWEKARGKPAKKRLIERPGARKIWTGLKVLVFLSGILGTVWAVKSAVSLVSATNATQWLVLFRDTFLTFLRVSVAVILGSAWTIPLGVFIGIHPVWTRRFQPVVQVVASFPAPMLFPLLTLAFSTAGLSIQWGAIILMIFASQWYILFNVISGATRIPTQLLELGEVYQLRGWAIWKSIILPAIFPSLVNGWITAAGGAWNASIVAEFVEQGKETLKATGIGATIFEAAKVGDLPRLAGGIIVMVSAVVLLNRFFWGSLYRLAETKYRLEG